MKNKKTFERIKRAEFSIVTALIIVLIVFLVLLSVWAVWSGYFKNNREICKVSVLAKANTNLKIPVLASESQVALQCRTQYIDVKKTGIYQNDMKISSANEETIRKMIAKEMYGCWYQFLMGKQNPFGDSSASRCVVCSQITFEVNLPIDVVPNLESQLNKELKGIVEFPAGMSIPASGTYFVIFQARTESSWQHVLKSIGGGVAAGTVVGAVGGSVVPIAGNIVGAGAGAVGGAVVGFVGGTIWAAKADKYIPGLLLTSSADFSKECDKLY